MRRAGRAPCRIGFSGLHFTPSLGSSLPSSFGRRARQHPRLSSRGAFDRSGLARPLMHRVVPGRTTRGASWFADVRPWNHRVPKTQKTLPAKRSHCHVHLDARCRMTLLFLELALMLVVILVASELFTNALEHLGERLG